MVQRRRFIKQIAVGSAAAIAAPRLWGATVSTGKSDKFGDILPTRPLGKTGEEVTIYCMGGAHVSFAANEKESHAIIEKGMEMGVRFYENAWTYGKGKAEELYGKYLIPKYRDQIFLATKTKSYTAEDARKQLEDSFRRMKCDVIDLCYIHEIRSPEDADIRISAGVLEVLLEAQQKGQVKYLGFTGHMNPDGHRRMMEHVAGKDPFVAVQHPVNPIDAGKPKNFTTELIPELLERGYAVMGMKPFAHGRFFADNRDKWETNDPVIPNHLSVEEVIWHNLSRPITSMVCGTDKEEQVVENVNAVKKFAKLSMKQQEKIVAKLSQFTMTDGLEYYRPTPGTY